MQGKALLLIYGLLSAVSAEFVELWWNITYADANPDGRFNRKVIGVNGTWPPPPVEVKRGDTVVLHALNSLDVPTALHHHGIFFRGMPYFDGAAQISQCGIPPGEWFTYKIPVAEQWGTYWMHAHEKGQYVDGLRSPFIIHNPSEPYHYDEEFTLSLGDWYHKQHEKMQRHFLSKANPTGAEPVPQSPLIYFSQNGRYLTSIPSSPSEKSSATPGFNENSGIVFQPNKTYKIRVINMSALSMFWLRIAGHEMRIVEVDGTDVEEYPVDKLDISAAQRYSILVKARSDPSPSSWAIHAEMDPEMFDLIPDDTQMSTISAVHYLDSSQDDASFRTTPLDSEPPQHPRLADDMALKPLNHHPIAPPTKRITLIARFETMDDGTNRGMFNNVTFNHPIVPSLFSALSMGESASLSRIYGPNAEVLQYGDVVEIQLINMDDGIHPFHLHGHRMAVVHKAEDINSNDPVLNPPFEEGNPNPLYRDTVMIPGSGGSATLRFVADNPGAWIFHCHIEWHLESGLAFTFIEAPQEIQKSIKPPQYMFDHCQSLNRPWTGNAAGHNSTTDYTGLKVGPYPQVLGWHTKGLLALGACFVSAAVGMLSVIWYAWDPYDV